MVKTLKSLWPQWQKILAVLMLCLAPLATAWAEVTATLSDNPVVKGQSLTLTIRVVDEDGEPDLGVLGSDFKVLGQSTSSQVQYVNGKVSKWKDWNIQLLPSRSGRLVVPAIPVGKSSTSPLVLEVVKQPAGQSREAWIEFSADPIKAWQGQQIVLSVQLYYQNTVRSGDLSAPSARDAVVEQLGEDHTDQTIKAGVRYNRLTRRYLLFPEQAGRLTVEGPVFNGQAEAARSPSRSFGGLFRNTRQVAVAADDLNLTVMPPPEGVRGFWLPAQDVDLSAEWGNGVTEFRVGEPVTRVVTLRAFGLLATQLPELEFDYPGLRVYPEDAEQESRANDKGVVGIRHYRTAVIPQKPGRYVIPAFELQWWDVNRAEMRTATLPEETINVLPAAVGNNQQLLPPPVVAEPCDSTPAEFAAAPVCEATESPQQAADSSFWMWLSLLLSIAWLVTIFWGVWFWRKTQRSVPQASPSTVNIKGLRKQLLAACQKHDAAAAVKVLAELAGAANLPVTSPAAVANVLNHAGLSRALLELDRAYYSGQPSASQGAWNGDDLAAALKDSEWPQVAAGKAANKPLPDLYPQ